jgi:Second Messenger Oligonucleotide or Dinucleotide Synthetase domain/Adenylyl/Guanylyl and SMODS C-terminal sensor domain
VKHTAYFKSFLSDVVDLNQTRLNNLDSSVTAIKNFLNGSDWTPNIIGYEGHGSWAHRTIIKPVANAPFDADLLVRVDSVDGWTAKDYVNTLRQTFAANTTYGDMTTSSSHCVTITYADERMVDVAPLVVARVSVNEQEVCNRPSDAFEASNPKGYTDRFNERNGYSKNNSFRKVTRLVKYLRDIKKTFTCPSILLTTLLGERISWLDKDSDEFKDTPTALQTIFGRLDDHLQANATVPMVQNPSSTGEDFGDLLTDGQYTNLRIFVNKYRGWIDEAIQEDDLDLSLTAWRRVFGESFAKDAPTKATLAKSVNVARVPALLSSVAHHADHLVEMVRDFGHSILPATFYRPPHLKEPTWIEAWDERMQVRVTATHHVGQNVAKCVRVAPGEALRARGGIWFEARQSNGAPIGGTYNIHWRITNTGAAALIARCPRGDFYGSWTDGRRWEPLAYRGVHLAEAFVVRQHDNKLVGQSKPFHVLIE